LAGVDPDTGAPRRRVARKSEIPHGSEGLIDLLVEQRLLRTDVSRNGEQTIEPVHDALLRQWSLLKGWLAEDSGLLSVLEGVKSAARDWLANNKEDGWLTHSTVRLHAAKRLLRERPDLCANLTSSDREYLIACREKQRSSQLRNVLIVALLSIFAALLSSGWLAREYLEVRWSLFADKYLRHRAAVEEALEPGKTFQECTRCPLMVVLPSGQFNMGSPDSESDRDPDEGPQRVVEITRQIAVSRFEITFEEWDTCVAVGECINPGDQHWGRGKRPVINVGWNDAKRYVAWLSSETGKLYRLLSEAEWEYAARAGSSLAYSWGEKIGDTRANCFGCGSQWDYRQTAPVGSFVANAFGLYDMHGNVWEWVEDCYHETYKGAPADDSPWITGECRNRVLRGGSWNDDPKYLRAANRHQGAADARTNALGFRVARTLVSRQSR
jgi:formylglycine-generating enzyme required for sulfatase activity